MTVASGGPPTLAGDTQAEGGERLEDERAFLVVYVGRGDDVRTQMVSLPLGLEVVLGRSRDATVLGDDERISRLNTRIVREDAGILVSDLDSRNGTLVNGARIAAPVRVEAGDVITVGSITAVVGSTTPISRRAPLLAAADLEDRLLAEIDRAVRYQRPLSLVMLRIAGELGAVDQAIGRLRGMLRRMDILAEYVPGELAIVLPETASDAAAKVAQRLLDDAQRDPAITAQVGVATAGHPGSPPAELLGRARTALRAARRAKVADDVVPAPTPTADDGELVATAPQMRRVVELARTAAATNITVLLLGETGVGKELLAELVHRRSARAKGPFVRLNCAALPVGLLESELFGHERGAFTGADRRREGYFEAAREGTLFLDEIGEVPVETQVKLLRVLEERKLVRVGATAEVPIDVRVVCATNRDLEAEVRGGRFRQDLYFRLSAFTLVVPPLRDRPGEIRALVERFAASFAGELDKPVPALSGDALIVLEAYAWPGNVRELRNAIERAVVLESDGTIELWHLPEAVRCAAASIVTSPLARATPAGTSIREHLAEVERASLITALKDAGGNQSRAARQLGISRRSLIHKMERYGLKRAPGTP